MLTLYFYNYVSLFLILIRQMLTWLKKILRKTLLIYAYYDFYCTWMRFLTRVLVRNILDINIEGKNCRTKFYFKPFRCVTHFNAMFCCFHSTSLHSTMWIMPKSKQGRNNLLTVSRKRQFRMAIKTGMSSESERHGCCRFPNI